MSKEDKSKLDGIENNANNYILPNATVSVLGGVKIGSGLNIDNGKISLGHHTHEASDIEGLVEGAHQEGETYEAILNLTNPDAEIEKRHSYIEHKAYTDLDGDLYVDSSDINLAFMNDIDEFVISWKGHREGQFVSASRNGYRKLYLGALGAWYIINNLSGATERSASFGLMESMGTFLLNVSNAQFRISSDEPSISFISDKSACIKSENGILKYSDETTGGSYVAFGEGQDTSASVQIAKGQIVFTNYTTETTKSIVSQSAFTTIFEEKSGQTWQKVGTSDRYTVYFWSLGFEIYTTDLSGDCYMRVNPTTGDITVKRIKSVNWLAYGIKQP